MGAFVDLKGKKFGRLTVLDRVPRFKKDQGVYWLVKCDCGTVKQVMGAHMKSGHTLSCGCYGRERASAVSSTHGETKNRKRGSPTFRSWRSMWGRVRCEKEDVARVYKNRGISVCDRWTDYRLFLSDMGERPLNTTLDRIDVNKGYEPSNCRWATKKQQGENRRSTRMITFNGHTMCVSDWAKKIGRSPLTIKRRLDSGWPVERALTP